MNDNTKMRIMIIDESIKKYENEIVKMKEKREKLLNGELPVRNPLIGIGLVDRLKWGVIGQQSKEAEGMNLSQKEYESFKQYQSKYGVVHIERTNTGIGTKIDLTYYVNDIAIVADITDYSCW